MGNILSNIPPLIKRAVSMAIAITALVETIMTIVGASMRDIAPGYPWWMHLLILTVAFAVVAVLVGLALRVSTRREVTIEVGGNTVHVVCGDIFATEGKKVIPFNEFFDTVVDDVTISSKSLNGKFIREHVADVDELVVAIASDSSTSLPAPKMVNGRLRYELGTIKRYGDYLLLAFTHFNELKESYLTMGDYERCLMNMWGELSRTHAGYEVVLPLLGSGLTRFEDLSEKSFDNLLKCMICTLRVTGCSFSAPITVVLTEKAAEKMHLFEIRESFVGRV